MRGLNELVYKKCLENIWYEVSPQEMLAVVITVLLLLLQLLLDRILGIVIIRYI